MIVHSGSMLWPRWNQVIWEELLSRAAPSAQDPHEGRSENPASSPSCSSSHTLTLWSSSERSPRPSHYRTGYLGVNPCGIWHQYSRGSQGSIPSIWAWKRRRKKRIKCLTSGPAPQAKAAHQVTTLWLSVGPVRYGDASQGLVAPHLAVSWASQWEAWGLLNLRLSLQQRNGW